MLGLGRASQYAGWWNQNQAVTLKTSLTVSSTIAQPFLVSPRYYVDMNGSASNAQVYAKSPGGGSFDMTGVVNQPKRSVQAMTFQIGTNWMVSASTSGFVAGNQSYNIMSNNGTESYYSIQINKLNGAYQFTTNGFLGLSLSAAALSSYRNRWLTAIICTSDSTSDFANWTGTGANTYSWASRVVLYDILSDTVIATADTYATQAVGTVDLTQTWTFGYASSSYFVNNFINFSNLTLYDTDEFLISQQWFAIGETLDPGVYYSELAGNAVNSTVDGVRAWLNINSNSVGTVILDGNLNDYGYYVDIGTWGGARQPSDSQYEIHGNYNQVPPDSPVFVSF